MYESLTKYLDVFKEESHGKWVIDENKVHFPYVNYDDEVRNFLGDIMAFVDAHEEMRLKNYYAILEDLGIEQSAEGMAEADPESLDGQAGSYGAYRGEHAGRKVLRGFSAPNV